MLDEEVQIGKRINLQIKEACALAPELVTETIDTKSIDINDYSDLISQIMDKQLEISEEQAFLISKAMHNSYLLNKISEILNPDMFAVIISELNGKQSKKLVIAFLFKMLEMFEKYQQVILPFFLESCESNNTHNISIALASINVILSKSTTIPFWIKAPIFLSNIKCLLLSPNVYILINLLKVIKSLLKLGLEVYQFIDFNRIMTLITVANESIQVGALNVLSLILNTMETVDIKYVLPIIADAIENGTYRVKAPAFSCIASLSEIEPERIAPILYGDLFESAMTLAESEGDEGTSALASLLRVAKSELTDEMREIIIERIGEKSDTLEELADRKGLTGAHAKALIRIAES